MQIKSVLAGAAIALAAAVGSASAAETFDTLHGVPVEALPADALDDVRGAAVTFTIFPTICAEVDPQCSSGMIAAPTNVDIDVNVPEGVFVVTHPGG